MQIILSHWSMNLMEWLSISLPSTVNTRIFSGFAFKSVHNSQPRRPILCRLWSWFGYIQVEWNTIEITEIWWIFQVIIDRCPLYRWPVCLYIFCKHPTLSDPWRAAKRAILIVNYMYMYKHFSTFQTNLIIVVSFQYVCGK